MALVQWLAQWTPGWEDHGFKSQQRHMFGAFGASAGSHQEIKTQWETRKSWVSFTLKMQISRRCSNYQTNFPNAWISRSWMMLEYKRKQRIQLCHVVSNLAGSAHHHHDPHWLAHNEENCLRFFSPQYPSLMVTSLSTLFHACGQFTSQSTVTTSL